MDRTRCAQRRLGTSSLGTTPRPCTPRAPRVLEHRSDTDGSCCSYGQVAVFQRTATRSVMDRRGLVADGQLKPPDDEQVRYGKLLFGETLQEYAVRRMARLNRRRRTLARVASTHGYHGGTCGAARPSIALASELLRRVALTQGWDENQVKLKQEKDKLLGGR